MSSSVRCEVVGVGQSAAEVVATASTPAEAENSGKKRLVALPEAIGWVIGRAAEFWSRDDQDALVLVNDELAKPDGGCHQSKCRNK